MDTIKNRVYLPYFEYLKSYINIAQALVIEDMSCLPKLFI